MMIREGSFGTKFVRTPLAGLPKLKHLFDTPYQIVVDHYLDSDPFLYLVRDRTYIATDGILAMADGIQGHWAGYLSTYEIPISKRSLGNPSTHCVSGYGFQFEDDAVAFKLAAEGEKFLVRIPA